MSTERLSAMRKPGQSPKLLECCEYSHAARLWKKAEGCDCVVALVLNMFAAAEVYAAMSAALQAAWNGWIDVCREAQTSEGSWQLPRSEWPLLSHTADLLRAAQHSHTFTPMCFLLGGVLLVLIVILHVLQQRAESDAADADQKANEALAEVRARQRHHQISMEDKHTDVEAAEQLREQALENLHRLKQRCAKRFAFARHIRMVNHNFTADYSDLRAAFDDALTQANIELPSNSSSIPPGAEPRQPEVDDKTAVTPHRGTDVTGERSAETPTARLFASPASVASDQLGPSPAPQGNYSEERRKKHDYAQGDALLERVAAAVARVEEASRRRDAAMEGLHGAEREADSVEVEFDEMFGDFEEHMRAMAECIEDARDALVAQASPARGQQQQQSVTQLDVELLSFNP
jgi:hypothetical protein